MAKKAPSSAKPAPKSEEFENFEKAVRKVLTVPKKDLDAAIEREKQARSGNGR